MINIDNIISEKIPSLAQHPKIQRSVSLACKKLVHQDEINQFLQDNSHLGASEFLDKVMHSLGLSYTVDNWQLENIPTEGRVIMVSNHPLGSLDGIALLKLVSQVRTDIKIVTNEVLNHLEPLQSYFLPVTNMGGMPSKKQYRAIEESLNQDQAVIFFPAGEVSRFRLNGIKDCYWRSGFLHLALKTEAPILPLYVGGKNSRFFYGLSLISKPAAMLLLVKEMFRHAKITLPITIGEIIPFRAIKNLPQNHRVVAQLFRKHVYSLGNNKKTIFETEKPIAHPQARKNLKNELKHCELLTITNDGKEIYLLKEAKATCLLSEIGRLREISFRAVGEGTGHRVDIDEFDVNYEHIVLWDPAALEIVGAYRVKQTKNTQTANLYSQTLFEYHEAFSDLQEEGLELGRSFVQPKYWGKRSLDYLWYGIGAYLVKNPQLRYLFGPVSISADYSKELIEWLSFYYSHFYPAPENYASAKRPLNISPSTHKSLVNTFEGCDIQSGFKILKHQLKMFNKSVPTLLKQYTDLCQPGGVYFSGFNTDPLFNDCVDGLVIVDLNYLLEKKQKKYMNLTNER